MDIVGAIDGPLVALDQPGETKRFDPDDTGERLCDIARVFLARFSHEYALLEIDDALTCGNAVQSKHRASRHHLDPVRIQRRSIRSLEICRQDATSGEIQRLERPGLVLPVHLRILDVHHDDAGKAPHGHDEPKRDAQISMQEKDRTIHERCLPGSAVSRHHELRSTGIDHTRSDVYSLRESFGSCPDCRRHTMRR